MGQKKSDLGWQVVLKVMGHITNKHIKLEIYNKTCKNEESLIITNIYVHLNIVVKYKACCNQKSYSKDGNC